MSATPTSLARWSWALVVLALVVGATLARWSLRGSPVVPASAPDDVFSQERWARRIEALDPGGPRPTGSEANAELRRRARGQLEALGLRVEEQPWTRCVGWTCGEGTNLIALPPEGEGPCVALAAHLDSVLAGPGAADDLANVAIAIEVAELARRDPTLRERIAVLLTDGEELGLTGAREIVQHPAFARVEAVVNLEARGRSGPSLLFETKGPAGVAGVAVRGLKHPASNALLAAVYRLMPNDTDLTVFGAAGRAGVNLAFMRGRSHYHTGRDDRRWLDPATIQHQGDNALAAVEALATAPELSDEELVWTDLYGQVVVVAPAWAMIPLALLALAMVLARGVISRRDSVRGARRRAVAAFAMQLGASLLVLAVVGGTLAWKTAGLLPHHPHPFLVLVATTASCFAIFGAVGRWLGPDRADGAAVVGWGIFAALGVATVFVLPALSVLFALPTLVASLAWMVGRGSTGGRLAADLGGFTVAVFAWFVPGMLLIDAFEAISATCLALLWALLGAPLMPIAAQAGVGLRGRRGLIALGAVGLGAFVATAAWPAFDEANPRWQSMALFHHDGEASWVVDVTFAGPDPGVLKSARFGAQGPSVLPGILGLRAVIQAPADVEPLAAPQVDVSNRDGRRVATITSRRGARIFAIVAPGDQTVLVAGKPVRGRALSGARFGGRQLIRLYARRAGPIEVELAAGGELFVADVTGEVPSTAAPVVARGREGTPWGLGDVTVVGTTALLE